MLLNWHNQCILILYRFTLPQGSLFRASRAIVSCSNGYWAEPLHYTYKKLQLQVNVELKYYDDIIIDADINRAIQQRNRAKLLEQYIGMTFVNTYSPNGKIQISSASSKYYSR
jgi:hypothetical protein